MRFLLELVTIVVVTTAVNLMLKKLLTDEFWITGLSVGTGIAAGRLVNPHAYKNKD